MYWKLKSKIVLKNRELKMAKKDYRAQDNIF